MVRSKHSILNRNESSKQTSARYRDDVESNAHSNGNGNGNSNSNIRRRFKNAISSIVEDQRRVRMKQKLVDGIDHQSLEAFRKSPEELKEISNKKIRRFYEDQNERLNDWLEVDTIVKHLADDVIDSFDPHDEDQDGIPEGGALQGTDERIEPFLPQEERERRQKDRKYTKWAININVIANIILLIAKIVAVFFSQSLSLIASLADSALDLLCTLIVWTTNRLVASRIAPLSKRFPVSPTCASLGISANCIQIGRKRLEPIGILVFSIVSP